MNKTKIFTRIVACILLAAFTLITFAACTENIDEDEKKDYRYGIRFQRFASKLQRPCDTRRIFRVELYKYRRRQNMDGHGRLQRRPDA